VYISKHIAGYRLSICVKSHADNCLEMIAHRLLKHSILKEGSRFHYLMPGKRCYKVTSRLRHS